MIKKSHQTIDQTVWQHHEWQNRLQTILLLGLMGLFIFYLSGFLFDSLASTLIVLVSFVVIGFVNPAFSPNLIMRLYNATVLRPEHSPKLWQMMLALSRRAGLSNVPTIYYIPSSTLNAFAVGNRNNAGIGLTDGLLRRLNDRELLGVLAHEVSHVRNNDLWVMGIADVLSRITSFLSLFGQLLFLINLPLILFYELSINWVAIVLLVFAPHMAALSQLALSRTREYDADLNAARLTDDVDGLASALVKIDRIQGRWLERIVVPSHGMPEPSWLRSHPPTQARVEKLMSLKPELDQRELLHSFDPKLEDVIASLRAPVRRRPGWHISGLWH